MVRAAEAGDSMYTTLPPSLLLLDFSGAVVTLRRIVVRRPLSFDVLSFDLLVDVLDSPGFFLDADEDEDFNLISSVDDEVPICFCKLDDTPLILSSASCFFINLSKNVCSVYAVT